MGIFGHVAFKIILGCTCLKIAINTKTAALEQNWLKFGCYDTSKNKWDYFDIVVFNVMGVFGAFVKQGNVLTPFVNVINQRVKDHGSLVIFHLGPYGSED